MLARAGRSPFGTLAGGSVCVVLCAVSVCTPQAGRINSLMLDSNTLLGTKANLRFQHRPGGQMSNTSAGDWVAVRQRNPDLMLDFNPWAGELTVMQVLVLLNSAAPHSVTHDAARGT